MSTDPVKVDMKPTPPSEFIHDEILGELGLSIAHAARSWRAHRNAF